MKHNNDCTHGSQGIIRPVGTACTRVPGPLAGHRKVMQRCIDALTHIQKETETGGDTGTTVPPHARRRRVPHAVLCEIHFGRDFSRQQACLGWMRMEKDG